jgi:hypothetical protein
LGAESNSLPITIGSVSNKNYSKKDKEENAMEKRMMYLKGSALIALVFLALGLGGTFYSGEASAQVRPAIVRDLDNGDRQQIYLHDVTVLQFDGLRASDECLDPVPAGKRLVIEHVTARVYVPIGQSVYAALKIGGIYFGTLVPLVSQGTINGRQVLVSSTPARLRIDAGDRACMLLHRDLAVEQATGLFTISGYLIDAP